MSPMTGDLARKRSFSKKQHTENAGFTRFPILSRQVCDTNSCESVVSYSVSSAIQWTSPDAAIRTASSSGLAQPITPISESVSILGQSNPGRAGAGRRPVSNTAPLPRRYRHLSVSLDVVPVTQVKVTSIDIGLQVDGRALPEARQVQVSAKITGCHAEPDLTVSRCNANCVQEGFEVRSHPVARRGSSHETAAIVGKLPDPDAFFLFWLQVRIGARAGEWSEIGRNSRNTPIPRGHEVDQPNGQNVAGFDVFDLYWSGQGG